MLANGVSRGAASPTKDAAVETTCRADRGETIVRQDPAEASGSGVGKDMMSTVAVESGTGHESGR